ncbi:MAG: UDP-N-acetylglucosamine 4,6-dehydratase (inverting) [Anaerolineales bacterium]|nr:UDP-N-acetylglucosamine 4,6-dehydratase (inverting) [Anaerolineales bacterium]
MDWKKLSVLITGGTGSFGQKFVEFLLRESPPRRIIIFSRDEFKQMEMRQRFPDTLDSPLRYFIGDVRDKERLFRAFRGVDVVVHAAALKQVPTAEYNPFEAVKTNVFGAQNVIDAAIDCGVEKVVALSTDKAVNPVNIYGATKLCAEKIFIQGNAYSGDGGPKFSCVRYGNVLGSRGSVLPLFNDQKKTGKITITDKRMTRFWITLDDAVELVIKAFWHMEGGEVFVPKIPSMRVIDLAKAIAPHCEIKVIGIRPGEKLHEVLVTEEEGRNTVTYDGKYVILPNLSYWKRRKYKNSHKVPEGFIYTSDKNNEWLTIEDLRRIVYDSSLCKEDSASSLLSTIHKLNEKIVLDMIDSEERPRSTELTAQSGDNR